MENSHRPVEIFLNVQGIVSARDTVCHDIPVEEGIVKRNLNLASAVWTGQRIIDGPRAEWRFRRHRPGT